eukprot:CAMPEP_0183731874 /NCGR_PEP_ID=MMETSP0737-20130205/36703_1 /TAXON_ID=385413 /ORGANISM="Thalassiosira miniscula, Strain CCMP1093" /LENGTH=352 /DNA_ID=CAMNT_0025964719 /DNA_START=314 /DNA_END=1372 /DNA_ORIENTATION=-
MVHPAAAAAFGITLAHPDAAHGATMVHPAAAKHGNTIAHHSTRTTSHGTTMAHPGFLRSKNQQAKILNSIPKKIRSWFKMTEASFSVFPWAKDSLHSLFIAPEPSKEAFLFWHIPKSGGSTIKQLYRCMGKTVSVNSYPEDIMKAKNMGLVSSAPDIMISSSNPSMVVENLFGSSQKTRALAMFRHPVERLISKFYYLQTATWERSYRPEWKDMDVHEWAKTSGDNDHMMKKLAGKERVNKKDLELAKNTIKMRFVVGLMHEMEDSVKRFNVVMGINEKSCARSNICMDTFFGAHLEKKNSNPHPKVERDSPAWQLLAEKNRFDIELYDYVLQLYEEQKELIDFYSNSMSTK